MVATILVTASANDERRATIGAELPDGVDCSFLDDVDPADRPDAVEAADGVLSMAVQVELDDDAFARLHDDQVLQTISAGVDFLPFDRLPDGLTIQSNAGAYAEPMAEHVLAMYLALSKRLLVEHRKMADGEFDQFRPNRQVEGSTCAIFGFGAIGEATARLMKPLGIAVEAINRSGESDEPVDFLGTPDDLEAVLGRCDGLVLAAPLTPETRGLIDREKLELMADDATLINVARGEIVDQGDLYAHLEANPEFGAAIDAWWTEPLRDGEFSLDYPFFELPNVLGSPHNSAQVPGIREVGIRHATRNLVSAVEGGEEANVVDPELGY
jgi:glycerate dehydrogenase